MRYIFASELLGLDDLTSSFGVSFGDADQDGDMDLWLGNHGGRATLLVNELTGSSGVFRVEVMEAAATGAAAGCGCAGCRKAASGTLSTDGSFTPFEVGENGDKHGAVWADLDADGDADLLQLRGGGRGGQVPKPMEDLGNQLFLNEGVVGGVPQLVYPDDGLDLSDSLGLNYAPGRGRTPTVLDYDLDGRLDVFIGNESRDDGAVPSVLFRQLPDGTFVAQPDALGVPGQGFELAVPSDFDGDGLLDLFLQNTDGGNVLLLGTGAGFVLGPALPPALADVDALTSDIVVADFDNDGRFDIWQASSNGNRLFLNEGGAEFRNVSDAAGLRIDTSPGVNAGAGDFDNDGDVDVYVMNDDIGAELNLPNIFWENLGVDADGIPVFVARMGEGYAPADDQGVGFTVAVGEVNGDGVLDLLVANGASGERKSPGILDRNPHDLYLGEATPGHAWLMVDLVGVVSNIEGIGATLVAEAGGTRQLRFADNGVHNKTQNDPRLHFGFGALAPDDAVSLEIHWSSGVVQRLADLAPNRVMQVTELRGATGSDSITGTSAAESITGGARRDTLVGGGGDDTLAGGTGRDVLQGGSGADLFVYSGGTRDTVRDFQLGIDLIAAGADPAPTVSSLGGDALLTFADGSLLLAGLDAAAVQAALGDIFA